MSDGFEDRRKALEGAWAHDEDLRFKVHARRGRLVGLWAAGEMALSGKAADDYAAACVAIQAGHPGDDALFEKVRADLEAKGVARTDHLIRGKMLELLEAARDEVMRAG